MKHLYLFLVLSLLGCPDPKRPVTPDPDLDAAPSLQIDSCHKAGQRLSALKCKEYRKDWDTFCMDMMKSHIPIRPSCLATITKCEEIDTVCR